MPGFDLMGKIFESMHQARIDLRQEVLVEFWSLGTTFFRMSLGQVFDSVHEVIHSEHAPQTFMNFLFVLSDAHVKCVYN